MFQLPPADGGQARWHRWIDTSLPSPQDIVPPEQAPEVQGDRWTVPGRSLAVLLAGFGHGWRRVRKQAKKDAGQAGALGWCGSPRLPWVRGLTSTANKVGGFMSALGVPLGGGLAHHAR